MTDIKAQALTFQQLALHLVAAVKTLSSCAQGTTVLQDKELETKLCEVQDVVALGFSMPANMAVSLFQILTKLLISIVDINKDFLILIILELMGKVGVSCDQNAFKNKGVEVASLEFTKWMLLLIKDRSQASKATPGLQIKAIEIAEIFVKKGVFQSPSEGVGQILPAVSSVCCKALSQDYKCTAKVRQSLIQFWGTILTEYAHKLRSSLLNIISERKSCRPVIPKLNQTELTVKFDEPEEILRLTECLQFITDNIYKDIQQILVLKCLQKLTFDLICIVPFDGSVEFSFSLILLYGMATHLDLVLERLPEITGQLLLKAKIKKEFLSSIHELRRMKKVISQEERQAKLIKAKVLSCLMSRYQINIHSDEYSSLALSLRSLINFESPRFLIQEVAQSKSKIKETSPHFVDIYFSHSIDLYRDDISFMLEVRNLIQGLPEEISCSLSLIYSEEVRLLPIRESSATLQQKSSLLYLIAHLNQQSSLEEITIPNLLQVTFEVKFQIQEKYYACLFLNLWNQVSQIEIQTLDLQTKTRVFTMALSGLSSKLEIVSCLSWLILDELKLQFSCQNVSELLMVDQGYFFNNLFAKLRYFNTGMSEKHLLLTIESLKIEAPVLLAQNLIELCELIGQSVDNAMIYLEQGKILTSMDMLVTVTSFVFEQSLLSEDETVIKQKQVDFEKVDPKQHRKTLTNVLRHQILRVQPYMTANTTPQLSFKSLQIFQNCVAYLANRPMVTEREPENFSSEDAPNAVIPCTLSALAYELWGNLSSLLANGKPQTKAKTYDLLSQIALHAPQFLITSDRLQSILIPKIKQVIESTADADMLQMILLKSMAKMMKAFAQGYFKHLKALEQTSHFEILNAIRSLQIQMRQKLKSVIKEKTDASQLNRVKELITELESDQSMTYE